MATSTELTLLNLATASTMAKPLPSLPSIHSVVEHIPKETPLQRLSPTSVKSEVTVTPNTSPETTSPKLATPDSAPEPAEPRPAEHAHQSTRDSRASSDASWSQTQTYQRPPDMHCVPFACGQPFQALHPYPLMTCVPGPQMHPPPLAVPDISMCVKHLDNFGRLCSKAPPPPAAAAAMLSRLIPVVHFAETIVRRGHMPSQIISPVEPINVGQFEQPPLNNIPPPAPQVPSPQEQLKYPQRRNRRRWKLPTHISQCHSCGVTQTPEWRRGPNGAGTLCNACGLHHAKTLRQKTLKEGRRTRIKTVSNVTG